MFSLTPTHLRFTVEALTPVRLPGYNAGSQLRGALGNVMRRAYCAAYPPSPQPLTPRDTIQLAWRPDLCIYTPKPKFEADTLQARAAAIADLAHIAGRSCLGRGRVLANANSREFRDTGRASRVRISIRSTDDLALMLPTGVGMNRDKN